MGVSVIEIITLWSPVGWGSCVDKKPPENIITVNMNIHMLGKPVYLLFGIKGRKVVKRPPLRHSGCMMYQLKEL